jgi:hypothetical protein
VAINASGNAPISHHDDRMRDQRENAAQAGPMTERFHQGIGGQLIRKQVGPTNDNGADGKVACRSRLGGMLNYYYREAS